MKKEELLNLRGSFTWMWGAHFFIETNQGNFIWSDPDYDGTNVIYKYEGSYRVYLANSGIDFGRDKGTHRIGAYCGNAIWENSTLDI